MISAKIDSGEAVSRRFEFARDTFGFANELLWAYQFDPATGKTTVRWRKPRPDYTHRCFVLTRAVRQFRSHAQFDAGQKIVDDETYRHLIRKVISRNPEVMSGAAVFAGTRVPVQILLDYLEGSETIDDFLAGFPGVTREQVVAFLEQAKDRLIEASS